MNSERPQETFGGDLIEEAAVRVQEAVAVLEVIFEGDLLGELPARLDSRPGHQRAVSLLTIMQRDLMDLARRLEAGSLTIAVVKRVKGPGQG